jgi:uncharacterized OB-fold protein
MMGDVITHSAPPPEVDSESRPYWDALREHRIVLQRCTSCRRLRFPPMPGCPYCGARGYDDAEVPGTGTVYSFVRVHRALTPAMESEVPYVVAVVELDEGPRMIGRVEAGDVMAVAIGDRLQPRFVDHDAWTELRFTP